MLGSVSWMDQLGQIIPGFVTYFQGIAQRLVLTSLAAFPSGVLKIQYENGEEIATIGQKQAGDSAAVMIVRSDFFWIRALLLGDIGFSQSYMLQEISCPDLTTLFEFFIHNASHMNASTGSGITIFARNLLQSITKQKNHISTAKLNANVHYSLSNDMFAAFLSPDMTYSSPLWLPTSDPRAAEETLEQAQMRKLQYAISTTHIKSTDHVLEIGTGWGSFAILAAKTTGCRVTTVTASAAQKELAEQRIAEAGLSEKIKVVLSDYRELSPAEPFDKIVSIEMLEHVGPDFLTTYFECIDQYLKKEGGVAYFQCITIPEARYANYLKSEDFIKKYIFPGGHLPTFSTLVSSINQGSKGRLIVEEVKPFGGHYSKALRCWRDRYLENFEEMIVPVLQSSYPEMNRIDIDIFKRKWEYYFCYCEAGFKTKTLGDVGITVAREGCQELLEDIP